MTDLKFDHAAVEKIGDKHDLGFGWVVVSAYLDDATLDAHPSVEIEVPLNFGPDDTLQAIRETAYKRAIEVLQVALDGMRASDPPAVNKPARKPIEFDL